MKSYIKKVITNICLIIIVVIIFPLSPVINYSLQQINRSEKYTFDGTYLKKPSSSGFWTPTYIHINNDNWSAMDFDWIQNRTGTFEDPHIIENVTINGQNLRTCILIESSTDYFIIRNCTLYNSKGGGLDAGLYIKTSQNGLIINNNCSDNSDSGIVLETCSYINVTANIVNDNAEGIRTQDYSHNITIAGNTVKDNTVFGIRIVLSDNITILDNICNGNVEGINLNEDANYCLVSGNFLSGNGDDITGEQDGIGNILVMNNFAGIYRTCKIDNSDGLSGMLSWDQASSAHWCSGNGTWVNPYTIENVIINTTNSPTGSGVYIVNSKNKYFIIKNVTVYNAGSKSNDAGIKLDNTNNGTLINNNCSYNSYNGIFLVNSENNTLSNNLAKNNSHFGIYFYEAHSNTVKGNNITLNLEDGIFLQNTNYVNITENLVYNNTNDGIRLENCAYCNISGFFYNNGRYGIHLYDEGNSCENNTISGCVTHHNLEGVHLSMCDENYIFQNNITNNTVCGIYLSSNSDINLIYNNSLIQNTLNAEDMGNNNMWNNSIIGNYWSNYTELGAEAGDLNDDGIGDIPYPIKGSTNPKDYLPIWEDEDNVKPILNVLSPLNGTYWNIKPYINVSANDRYLGEIWYGNGTFNVTLENNIPQELDVSIWNYLSEESQFYLYIYVNDSINNIVSEILTLYKDIKEPSITINSPQAYEGIGSEAPEIDLDISDKYLKDVWFSLDNESSSPIYYNWEGNLTQEQWDYFGEGIITLTFYAEDYAGNIGIGNISLIKHIGSWQLSPIVIDELGEGNYTWQEALYQGWCKGSGTQNDPYIIENLIIDGKNSGSCLEIRHSDVYFIIKNSSFYNSESGDHAGIKLFYVNNGQILSVNCSSNNGDGIFLLYCQNITIYRNDVYNNQEGIVLYESDNNLISNNNNSIEYNSLYGIYLEKSNNNTISKNAINNNNIGVFLNNSNYNIIFENVLNGNQKGIIEGVECIGNIIENNQDDSIHINGRLPLDILLIIIISAGTGILIIMTILILILRKKYLKKAKLEEPTIPEIIPESEEKTIERKIFLSYSTLDSDHFNIREIVEKLNNYPEISKVYYWEVDSGEDIVEYMEKTITICNVFVLFCSENAKNSKAVADEWKVAFQLRKKDLMKIIPVFENEDDIPRMLLHLLNVKYTNDNFNEFIENLYKEILRN